MTTKILILAANPKNTARLRLDEEVREIENGLQRAQKRESFAIKAQWAVRIQDIRRAMLDFQPNIVHFSGHGKGKAGIKLEDETGESHFVSAEALAGFFELFAEHVQCVVLNACYSETQAVAIAEHIPHVIGMSDAINDKTALEFAIAFYDALGAGRTVKFAYELACNAIQMAGIEEHLVPVLMTKEAENGGEDMSSVQHQENGVPVSNEKAPPETLQNPRQPLSPLHYALVSLIAFVAGSGLLWLYLSKADDLIAQGIGEKVFYILLIPLGFSAAAFLFGAMRSYATYTGNALGWMLELGGPIVIFVLVVIGGFKLVPETAPFPMTVYVRDSSGEIVLKNEGTVILELGGAIQEATIEKHGDAYFRQIPATFRHQPVTIRIKEAPGFKLAHSEIRYVLTGESISVEVERVSAVFGRIVDEELNGLKDVRVNIEGIQTITDPDGNFYIDIPVRSCGNFTFPARCQGRPRRS